MKLKDLQRIEFWIATILFTIAMIVLISNTGNRTHPVEYYAFQEYRITFSYFYNYFIPKTFQYGIVYIAFLSLNFAIVPSLIKKENTTLNICLIFGLFLSMGLIFSITKTYTEAYKLVSYNSLQHGYNRLFFNGFSNSLWIIIGVSGYVLLKEFIIYFINNKDQQDDTQSQIKLDIGFGLAAWFLGLLLWISSGANYQVMILWTLIMITIVAIVIYVIHYYLPRQFQQIKFSKYFWHLLFIIIIAAIPNCIVALIMVSQSDFAGILLLFHFPTHIILTIPLAWFIYKNRLKNSNQISFLKTELGKSDANLSFLQSQINPHFLFNALNTLYGTALQENAERTGEGIQKLGDMMRFMLHENVQDKISLTRDIDYLENYIALQKLRTSRSAAIVIETQIEEQLNNLEIAPMLLIPFVENAFKHGISLQKPSHIRINLQTKANTLYFDVHNSIHIKADNDPEKLKSGIGLKNVKQRLALLYPKKHELIIRESANEFFIHLTIQL